MFYFNDIMSKYLSDIYEKIPHPELKCLRCGKCCKSDVQLAVIEYLNVRQHIISSKIKPFYNNKKCIFLKQEKQSICIIYSHRPWTCRTYRPVPKDMSVYYVDIKKIRTTECCGYPMVNINHGKASPDNLIAYAYMIHELQQIFKEKIVAPENFFHKDNTFLGWQKECIAVVKNKKRD